MNRNYNQEFIKIRESVAKGTKLLLHSCCAPCSSAVLLRLAEYFDVTIFYYNPNIMDENEYIKRANEQQRFIDLINTGKTDIKTIAPIKVLFGEYDNNNFLKMVNGLEQQKEGGSRCKLCYDMRLRKTFEVAKEKGYDYFCSTLSVSPYKNAEWLNEIGENLQTDKVKWLTSDFKKKQGFLVSTKLSQKYGLYRQHYCGCQLTVE